MICDVAVVEEVRRTRGRSLWRLPKDSARQSSKGWRQEDRQALVPKIENYLGFPAGVSGNTGNSRTSAGIEIRRTTCDFREVITIEQVTGFTN